MGLSILKSKEIQFSKKNLGYYIKNIHFILGLKNTHNDIKHIQNEVIQKLQKIINYKKEYSNIIIDRIKSECHSEDKNSIIKDCGLRSSKHNITKTSLEKLPIQKFTYLASDINFAIEPLSIKIELSNFEIESIIKKGKVLGCGSFEEDDSTLSLQNGMLFVEREGIIYKIKKERLYKNDLSSVICDILYFIKEYPHIQKGIYDGLNSRPVIARGYITDLYNNMNILHDKSINQHEQ